MHSKSSTGRSIDAQQFYVRSREDKYSAKSNYCGTVPTEMTKLPRSTKHRGENCGRRPHGGSVDPLEEVLRLSGVEEAWKVLEEMQSRGAPISKFTVSRMLVETVSDVSAWLKPARIYRAISSVEKFIEQQPNAIDEVLFNAVLDTCCRLKDLKRLEATTQRMHDLDISPSPVTLGILVKAYGQAGNLQRVLEVWSEMKEQRKHANAVTFGCMIDACVKCGHLEKAVEIFTEMKQVGKHRNTILYTTLIKGYGLEKDLRHALELFREMPSEGVPRNTITFNSVLDACIRCGDLSMAESILCDMTSPTSSVKPDLISFSTILKGYCQFLELDKALDVLEAIKARGLRCDDLVYNTLMDGCVKANDIAAGLGLFEEMIRNGLRPSSITYSILERLRQRAGYDGREISETITQLYASHGHDQLRRGFEASRVDGSVSASISNTGRPPRRRRKRGGRGRNRQVADQSHQQNCSGNCYNSWNDMTHDGVCKLSVPLNSQLMDGSEVPFTGVGAPAALFNIIWCSPTVGADQHMLTPTSALKFTPTEAMHLQPLPAMEPAWAFSMCGA